jgi:hypothetical protein
MNASAGKHQTAAPEWGYSSAGRALAWHARGQRFDPAYLHQLPIWYLLFFVLAQ